MNLENKWMRFNPALPKEWLLALAGVMWAGDRMQDIAIRQFENGDASEVSQLIIDNLLLDNIHDYGEAAVRQLARFYSPHLVLDYAQNGEMVVAAAGSIIVGTATLDQNRVRNVFVRVGHHGQGIGRLLMQHMEETARQQGKVRLFLQANISAAGFYQNLGYVPVEEIEDSVGDARIKMVGMEKVLWPMGLEVK